MPLILASTSPTRQSLLRNAGLSFVSRRPPVDEAILKQANAEVSPQRLAQLLATAKALSVSSEVPGDIVIGADQVLNLNGRLFDKPASIEESREQLKALRGRTHTLISAVACARDNKVLWEFHEEARLTMRMFSDQFLDSYLAMTGADTMTSVGAYKLEGLGLQLFSSIEGDHFTILGLPMLSLLDFLRSSGEIAT